MLWAACPLWGDGVCGEDGRSHGCVSDLTVGRRSRGHSLSSSSRETEERVSERDRKRDTDLEE